MDFENVGIILMCQIHEMYYIDHFLKNKKHNNLKFHDFFHKYGKL